MTGGELLVECLIAQGVKVIFGMPGNQLTPVYEALYHKQGRIRHILSRHEGGASFMADGYARSSGEVGVCITIQGPGASNALTGLGEASTDCVPILLITSQNESRFMSKDHSKLFHGLDQLQVFKPVTKAIESIHKAEDIPNAIKRIFTALRTGRPRPAFIEICSDALTEETNSCIPEYVNIPFSDNIDVDTIHELISSSEKIVIIAGSGIHHAKANAELQELAELLYAPVFTTILGKGAIPEDHQLSLKGSRSAQAHEAIEFADLLLAIGTRFNQMDTNGWNIKLPEKWIHIEADPSEIGKEYIPTIGISGNLRFILQKLLKNTQKKNSSEWQNKVKNWKRQISESKPPEIIRLLREALPRDAIVSVDVHMTGYAMHSHFPTYVPGTFLYPGIYIAMGYGLPSAIGAKIANPDRKVIALAGDGSFLMTSMELATVVQNDLPIIVIISNDNALTSIRWSQERRFRATLGVEVKNPDFVAYANSFGIQAERVEDRNVFIKVLNKALSVDKPYVLELSPEVFH
ncbi:MAG: thiamine pyrophosphate-binding protein [bacterium]